MPEYSNINKLGLLTLQRCGVCGLAYPRNIHRYVAEYAICESSRRASLQRRVRELVYSQIRLHCCPTSQERGKQVDTDMVSVSTARPVHCSVSDAQRHLHIIESPRAGQTSADSDALYV